VLKKWDGSSEELHETTNDEARPDTPMDFQFTPHILPFAGAASVLALLLHVAWNDRRDPVARWFAATLAALTIWAGAYCFEILAVGVQDKIFFANVQFLGIATVSVCWWEMIRRYLDLREIPKAVTVALWLIAAATIIVAFANPGHIFRGVPSIVSGEAPFPILHADYGPWYSWVLIPETGILNAIVLFLLARAAIRAKRFYRRQFALLFFALFVPLLGSAMYVLGLSVWPDYNLTVALSGLSGLLMGVGLFRWRLFSIIPLAHDRVIETMTDGVIVADREDRIIDLNGSAERIMNLRRDDVFGRAASEVLASYPVLLEVLASPDGDPVGASRHDMVIRRNGIASYFALSSSKITGRHGDPLGSTVIMHDITQRVRLFEQARELANKDDLTGLPNRRHFFELTTREFDRARRYHKPLSLLVFDVDHFKQVNDTYGHRTGDRLLRDLAQACRRELRSSDVIGRVGGEEFAVLLPETELDVATEVAHRLREATESIRVASDQDERRDSATVTISVGVAQLEGGRQGDSETLDSLYERADRALYRAKGLGRNAVVASNETPVLRAVV
jgi:diguanylate cyclase (GGDEF)-like protein/PAS domain S-box-containing protein